jgi:hypothetical protein
VLGAICSYPELPFGSEERPSTLDAVIASAWERIGASEEAADCPVCGGRMVPRYGSGARPIGGLCVACGSTLT